jgi:hypothetical protein
MIQEEIERALQEKTTAKREGRSTLHIDQRLQELYKTPKRKFKRAKISIL